ncbi:MAG: hypothetical protein EBX41_05245 [Chitinophagia bacterium]|nr:hypothetical protein [Chitinophagia bacterium]
MLAGMLCLSSLVYGQDYCKQIKKEVTDNNTSFSYETPFKEDSMPPVRAVRIYSTNPDAEFDNFTLIFTLPCEYAELLEKKDGAESEKEESGIVITFEDKSKITDETLAITHDKRGSGYAARSATLTIGTDNIKDLSTKKIAKVKLSTAEISISPAMSNAMLQYINCLKNVKKLQ